MKNKNGITCEACNVKDMGHHQAMEHLGHDFKEPQHTPTPCEACEVGICFADHASDWEVHEGQDYVNIYGPGHDDSENPIATVANTELAAFIVRAVNCHEEMLAILKEIQFSYEFNKFDELHIKKAIAKAEGKNS